MEQAGSGARRGRRIGRAAPRWAGRALAALFLLGGGVLLAAPPRPARAPEAPPRAHNCRFWVVIGEDYPSERVTSQLVAGALANLRELGTANPDGWGFAFLPPASPVLPFQRPIVRRGGPPASDPDDPDYLRAAGEIARLRPPLAVGHVRRGSSGHQGVPDPHPFQEDGFLFAHNGGLAEGGTELLRERLSDYLEIHPLDYREGIGSSGPIDSELLFRYLRDYAETHAALAPSEAYAAAVRELAADVTVAGTAPRLNFLLTRGDTLYAVNYYGNYESNPVRYYRPPTRDGEAPSYWIVASEILGDDAVGWTSLPAKTLAVFAPGREPRYLSVGPEAEPRAAPARGALSPAGRRPEAVPAPPAVPPALAEPPEPHNCRFWGLAGEGYGSDLIEQHLLQGEQNLRLLGGFNPDGWGLAYPLPATSGLDLDGPIVRRGGPRASDPHELDYPAAIGEARLFAPPMVLAHVRQASSGHAGLPDPHPFEHQGYLFVHNGSLNAYPLEQELDAYLETHPPDYTTGLSGTGPIDSELYFLYLLRERERHATLPLADALVAGLRDLLDRPDIVGTYPMLNFLLAAGDTLFALNLTGDGFANSVYYYPAGGARRESSAPFWVVASQPLGETSAPWQRMPPGALGVFVPGAAPEFHAVLEPPDPVFTLNDLHFAGQTDGDGDGWVAHFSLCCDPNASWGSWDVSLRLLGRADSSQTWLELVNTRYTEITEDQADLLCAAGTVRPDTLAPTLWELRLELYRYGVSEPVAVADAASHPTVGLGAVPVEGLERDQVPDELRAFAFTRVRRTADLDEDGDGYLRRFRLEWDADLFPPWDTTQVQARLTRVHGDSVRLLGESAIFELAGAGASWDTLTVTVTPETLPPAAWDLRLELFDAEAETLVATAGSTGFPALAAVPVEGRSYDEPGALALRAGRLRPNPNQGTFAIPLTAPQGRPAVELALFDVNGRLLWEGRRPLEGETVSWSAPEVGLWLPSGIYFCRLRVSGVSWTRRVVVVR